MTTVMDCIERIPTKLMKMLNERERRFNDLHLYLMNRNISKIIFVASGSSFNSANTTRYFFEKLGFEVQFAFPNIFVNYSGKLDQDALYVVISQGGCTKLVYEALLKIKQENCLNCSITASLDSPIAEEADVAIEMGCDYEEFMYRTLGYSTTVMTCYQLALEIAELNGNLDEISRKRYDDDFRNMIHNLKVIKEVTLEWYEKHRFSLMKKQEILFTGTNDLWAVSNEADIKVMEMVPMLTRSFELEEFIHGPQNAFNDRMAFFVLGRSTEDANKVNSIAQFLKKEIGFCCVVGDIGKDHRDLYFEIHSKWFSALEFVTFAQVLAYKLADDFGRDLTKPVNGCIKKYINKTL